MKYKDQIVTGLGVLLGLLIASGCERIVYVDSEGDVGYPPLRKPKIRSYAGHTYVVCRRGYYKAITHNPDCRCGVPIGERSGYNGDEQ